MKLQYFVHREALAVILHIDSWDTRSKC